MHSAMQKNINSWPLPYPKFDSISSVFFQMFEADGSLMLYWYAIGDVAVERKSLIILDLKCIFLLISSDFVDSHNQMLKIVLVI